MTIRAPLALLIGTVVGCSTQGNGGQSSTIGPEPTSNPTTEPGAGGGPPTELNDQTARWVMERLPGEYDSSAQSEEIPELAAKHLWVCAIEAPELGDRVLYVEWSDLDSVDRPDVQLVLVIEPVSWMYNVAVALQYVPVDYDAWVGLCDGSTTPPSPPSELERQEECDQSISYNDATFFLNMNIDTTASCVPTPPPEAVGAFAEVIFNGREVRWHGAYFADDGERVEDPGRELEYVLRRVGGAL